MTIEVTQPRIMFWEDNNISVVVDGFCNHAGAQFKTEEFTSPILGDGGYEPTGSVKEEIFECKCGAWAYADMPNEWNDEHMIINED